MDRVKEVRIVIKKTTDKDIDHLGLDEVLKEKSTIDSLDMIESIIALEEHFNIQLRDEDMIKVKTLRDLVRCISIEEERGRGEYEDQQREEELALEEEAKEAELQLESEEEPPDAA